MPRAGTNRTRAFVRCAVGALALVALAACASIAERERAAMLADSVRAYAAAIRWSEFEAARAFLRPRDADPAAATDPARLAGVRVLTSDYAIEAASPEATEAFMTAVFSYRRADSASVRSVTQRARWWFDAEAERWYLDGGLPAF